MAPSGGGGGGGACCRWQAEAGGGGVAAALGAELALLRQRWPVVLCGLAFQYVHGIFTQLAYRMHQPQQRPLHDVGFELIPELPENLRWLSEALFTGLLLSFLAWTFSPLLFSCRRSFRAVLLWSRLLTVLVVCQTLRILSFTATQLPGPAPHCLAGAPTARRAPASAWWQHLEVDVRTQVSRSCGDLLFSSHMTFILVGALAYSHYGRHRAVKAAAWAAAACLAVLIVSARKHYTVDVVVAWYTVPSVYTLLHVYWLQQQQQQQPQLRGGEACACPAAKGTAAAGSGSKQQQQQPAAPLLPVSCMPGGACRASCSAQQSPAGRSASPRRAALWWPGSTCGAGGGGGGTWPAAGDVEAGEAQVLLAAGRRERELELP